VTDVESVIRCRDGVASTTRVVFEGKNNSDVQSRVVVADMHVHGRDVNTAVPQFCVMPQPCETFIKDMDLRHFSRVSRAFLSRTRSFTVRNGWIP
jgi:hypothetical protein